MLIDSLQSLIHLPPINMNQPVLQLIVEVLRGLDVDQQSTQYPQDLQGMDCHKVSEDDMGNLRDGRAAQAEP